MQQILTKIEQKILVSCQANSQDPIYEEKCLNAIVKSVLKGGAKGLRLAGADDIKQARKYSDLPIIGITKPDPLPEKWESTAYITPAYQDAKNIADAGADIIAIDGTSRPRPSENLAEIIYRIQKDLNKIVMTDISTFEEGLACALLGADIISTTLSGYTEKTINKNNDNPDFQLLERLVQVLNIPVILEGRIWTPEQVKNAFQIGAHSVVIGSAITRPQVITKRFIEKSTLKK